MRDNSSLSAKSENGNGLMPVPVVRNSFPCCHCPPSSITAAGAARAVLGVAPVAAPAGAVGRVLLARLPVISPARPLALAALAVPGRSPLTHAEESQRAQRECAHAHQRATPRRALRH